MEILTCFVWCLLILFYYVIKMEIKQLKRFFFCLYFNPVWVETVLLRLYCECISEEIWFNEIQHVYCILVTSHFGYVELRITRSIYSIPFDFEITRLTCKWHHILTLILAIFLSWKCCLFLSLLHIFVHFRLDFIMEVNTMNPDQTAPLEAVWSGSILFAI